MNEKKNKNSKFQINFVQEILEVIQVYCETIEITPEEYIKDVVIKDLIRTFVDVQREEHIYLGDAHPEAKKPLKPFFSAMKSAFEIKEENNFIK